MLTTQTNIALQIIQTLSSDEMATFAVEFNKIYKPNTISKPKNKKTENASNINEMAAFILKRHRAKNNIQKQDKLA